MAREQLMTEVKDLLAQCEELLALGADYSPTKTEWRYFKVYLESTIYTFRKCLDWLIADNATAEDVDINSPSALGLGLMSDMAFLEGPLGARIQLLINAMMDWLRSRGLLNQRPSHSSNVSHRQKRRGKK